jgi:hypothetical protein
MKFNAIKCYKMTIHRSTNQKNYTYMYSLDNHLLEHINKNPYLGLLIRD